MQQQAERITKHDSMLATEKLAEHLQEYLRSGLGTPRTTELIRPLLNELEELRRYLYARPVRQK